MSSGYFAEEYERPHVSIWQRVNRVLWALLVLTIVALVIGSFVPEIDKQRTEQAARERLHRLIEEQRTVHARHERELSWINNDPDYLASKYLRDKFDVMREGETILRVEGTKSGSEIPTVPTAARR